MSFTSDLTQEQLTEILKKGLYSDIQLEVTRVLTAEAQARFDSEIKPLIKKKVEEVVKTLTKVTSQMYTNPDTSQILIQVEIR